MTDIIARLMKPLHERVDISKLTLPNEIDAVITTMEIEMAEAADKIEGLQADLDSAIEVAFKRGARNWVALNYPDHFKRLNAFEPAA